MRRGMLQMKGAHEPREDTAQKIKNNRGNRRWDTEKKLRREIWEANIRRNKRLTETMEEMGC